MLVNVNSLTSTESVMTIEYYNSFLGFCSVNNLESQPESLGSILFGDRIYNSKYDIFMKQNEKCKTLCVKNMDRVQINFLRERIRDKYLVNWFIDGLPAAMKNIDSDGKVFYVSGFDLGSIVVMCFNCRNLQMRIPWFI